MTDLDQKHQDRYERDRAREERRLLRAEIAIASGRRDRIIGAAAGLAVVGAIAALMFLGGNTDQKAEDPQFAGGFVTQSPSGETTSTPSPQATHTQSPKHNNNDTKNDNKDSNKKDNKKDGNGGSGGTGGTTDTGGTDTGTGGTGGTGSGTGGTGGGGGGGDGGGGDDGPRPGGTKP
jgi:hypothetical protein